MAMLESKGYPGDYSSLGRIARPEEIARVIALRASPTANYMTGTVLDVNGGSAMG